MYLIWYAEQPWPGGLVGKQLAKLALDLLANISPSPSKATSVLSW